MSKQEERLYDVKEGENATHISNLKDDENAVAMFLIKSGYHSNVTKQGDLEGYVLYKNNEVYQLVGFGDDSKVLKDFYHNLSEEPALKNILLRFCNAVEVRTGKVISGIELEELF